MDTGEGLAERIHIARGAANISLQDLADQVHMSYATLQRRLTKRPDLFTIQQLDRIGDALGVDPAYIGWGRK